MDRKKLSTIIISIGGIGVVVCFVLFSFSSMQIGSDGDVGIPTLSIISLIGFIVSGLLVAAGNYIKATADIKNLKDSGITTNAKSVFNNVINQEDYQQSQVDAKAKTKCKYCNEVYDKSLNKCPSCGAKNEDI